MKRFRSAGLADAVLLSRTVVIRRAVYDPFAPVVTEHRNGFLRLQHLPAVRAVRTFGQAVRRAGCRNRRILHCIGMVADQLRNFRMKRFRSAGLADAVLLSRMVVIRRAVYDPFAPVVTERRNDLRHRFTALRAGRFAFPLMLAIRLARDLRFAHTVSRCGNETVLVGRAALRAGVERVADLGAGRSNR